jgi:FkbM family methyltransferase
MHSAKVVVKQILTTLTPYRAAVLLARAARFYVAHMPIKTCKASIVRGDSVLRICDWHRVVTTVTTRVGTRHKIEFPDLIQKRIFYFGFWEPAITSFIRHRLSPGDIFIDVGANIGYYTCLASTLVGATGKVHAIEALPSIYEALVESVSINHAKNVRTYNCAVYDREGTVRLFHGPATNIGMTTSYEGKARGAGMVEATEVKAMPLFQIVDHAELYDAKLVKIDVEGAEWFVLNGLRDHLTKFRPETEWLLEINPDAVNDQGGKVDDILKWFKDAGYGVYTIDNLYRADWYVEEGESYLARPLRELISPAPDRLVGEMEVIFSKTKYA